MKKTLGGLGLYALPALAFAASAPQLGYFAQALAQIQGIISTLLPIVVALALLFFFWGLAKFILAAGDESAKEEGKRIMIWGVVALFVMVSVWGLVYFLGNIVGVGQGQNLNAVPSVPGI